MNQHVPSITAQRRRKVLLWTPWGGQGLPDSGTVLESAGPRSGKGRPHPRPHRRPPKSASALPKR